MRKYYEILGLKPGANKGEVKKAYRKMAMRYHPDVNPSPGAQQKFTEILEAYEYLTGVRKAKKRHLSEAEKEQFYDLMRRAAEERAKKRYRERVREFRKRREEQQSREYQKGILVLGGILLVGIAVWQGYRFYKNLMINLNPVTVEAEVTDLARNRVIYEFPVNDSFVKDQEYVSNYNILMLADNGMPLRLGDRFELTFSREKPGLHKVDFSQVSPETLERYLELVSERLQYIYIEDWQDLSQSEQNIRSECMSLLIFQKYGFDGLGNVFFFDVNILDNFSHNSISWYFMRKSEEYQEIKSTCESDPAFRKP